MDGQRDHVDSKAMDDYYTNVYTTWKLSFDRLSESTRRILGIIAHLHHTGITEKIFERAFSGLSYDKEDQGSTCRGGGVSERGTGGDTDGVGGGTPG